MSENMQAEWATRPAKKLKTTGIEDPEFDLILLDQTDIWVSKILPFLGPGNYLFVAGINHRFKELYQEYFSRIPIKKIPRVQNVLGRDEDYQQPAVVTNSFYSAAFCTLSCAKLWPAACSP